MDTLRKRFRSIGRSYKALRKRAEQGVVRWQWASAPMHDPRPFWYEREGDEPGHALAAKPRQTEDAVEYGYDNEDRVVVAREGTSIKNAYYEEFFEYHPGGADGALFDYDADKEPLNVTRQGVLDGRLTSFELLGAGGYTKETYEYEGDRLTRIHVEGFDFDEDEAEPARTYDIRYNASGDPVTIELTNDDGEREVVWKARKQRPARKETDRIGRLQDEVRSGLVEQVPRKIAGLALSEPIYCVVLAYDTEAEEFLPPLVGVGLESEREHRLKTKGRSRLKHVLWNPAEFGHFDITELELDNKPLLKAAAELNEAYPDEFNLKAGRHLLNTAAAELMRLDWAKICPITADFIVFATDLEGSDYEANMKASVPAVRLELLRGRNWL